MNAFLKTTQFKTEKTQYCTLWHHAAIYQDKNHKKPRRLGDVFGLDWWSGNGA
jgi:hypothetical protein